MPDKKLTEKTDIKATIFCGANQCSGFHMITASVMKALKLCDYLNQAEKLENKFLNLESLTKTK